jgi:hypothetical protein
LFATTIIMQQIFTSKHIFSFVTFQDIFFFCGD